MDVGMMVALVLLAGLNLVVTLIVAGADALRSSQRWMQVALVWLIPFVGGVVVLAFLSADRSTSREGPAAAPDAGDDIALLDQDQGACGCAGTASDGDD